MGTVIVRVGFGGSAHQWWVPTFPGSGTGAPPSSAKIA
jgi:hypothetical protein